MGKISKKQKIIIFFIIILSLTIPLYQSYIYRTSIDSNQYIYETTSSEEIKTYLQYKRDFQQFFKGRKDIYSIKKVTIACKKFMENSKSSKLRDKIFEEYRNYYFAALKEINMNIYGVKCVYSKTCGTSDGNYIDRKNHKVMKFIKEKGGNLIWDDGHFYLTESPAFMFNNFLDYLSPMWVDYLNFRLKEQTEGYVESDKLIISYEELKNRIIFLENFLAKYPTFPEKNEVHLRIYQYLDIYLFGISNSPIFDKNTGELNKEAKQSYEDFIKNNTMSKYHSYILQYYKSLKENNFKYSSEIYYKIVTHLEKDHIKRPLTDIGNNYVFDNGYILSLRL